MTQPFDITPFVAFTETHDGRRWRVAAGDKRQGQHGIQIGIIALRHSKGYEVVMQLDNGQIDTFNPYMLFPERDPEAVTA